MTVSLSKGQKISLAKAGGGSLTRVHMGLGWDARQVRTLFGRMKDQAIDLDASCLLYTADKVLVDQVYFNQLKSKDGAIVHTGDNRSGDGDGDDESLIVDLSQVSPSVTSLVFVVSSYSGESFSEIENAFCRLVDLSSKQEIARYDLSGSGSHTAQIMAVVHRDGAGWSMRAVGERANGRTVKDLAGIAPQFL